MARSLNRTFSFDNGDELSMSSDRQEHFDHYAQPYRDAPSRDNQVSPIQTYSSPLPREYAVSPPSPPGYRHLPLDYPQLPQPTDSSDSHTPPPPPPPPPHSSAQRKPLSSQPAGNGGCRDRGLGHLVSNRTTSTTTPGMDNLGTAAAGGGIAGIALGVANENERPGGIDALGPILYNRAGIPLEREYDSVGSDTPYIPAPSLGARGMQHRDSYSSTTALGMAAATPGQQTPRALPSDENIPLADYPSPERYVESRRTYSDSPYKRYSTAWDSRVGDIDPNDIEDDGDDGLTPHDVQRSRSGLNHGIASDHGTSGVAMAGGAVAGGLRGGIGGLMSRKPVAGKGARGSPSGNYGPVSGQGFGDGGIEKSGWLTKQTSGRRKLRWILGIIMALVVIGAIAGGVVGGIRGAKNSDNGSTGGSGTSAAQDDSTALNKDSAEIKALMGNKGLHKVFPGVDYTPFNAQYPACLTNPPSQNNITRDMAVLSQLTNAVRLYGTDCNQTEMVLQAINVLGLTDMKVWLGVWVDNNSTTSNRQLSAMNDILDKNGATTFAGVIVGNEVLFRKDMTVDDLGSLLGNVKSNLTAKNIDLPLATSDLGDDWIASLAKNVDIVMSNIHPFFAGVAAAEAAAWTWDFWQQHDVILTQDTNKTNLISETGWPSTGGNDCGASTCLNSTQGSIAGIDEMNTFMDTFVCQALANGTAYFWFEAFDEPWKVMFNEAGKEWEDKWGLMDSGRKLKPGLVIPDCGNNTVS
ncbi:MAG: hypothetical protein FRX48_02403 [Lasallia pustulata]|uniref:glucan endo-1,3-beta-D-glucosidase n=1 Tax=Lasallia pustulata TaxID=136370 RepID=A0A5M8PXA3_9LECA|nr:MAG: hypothetical protein FRX48_02403 [Lasallia pustulata]